MSCGLTVMLGEFVSQTHCAMLAERARQQAASYLIFDPAVLRSEYNRRPFVFEHRLAEHPLMTLPALFALCRRLPEFQVGFRFGVVPGDTDFDTSLSRYRDGLTLDDAIERLEERQAYICVNNPERDAQYRPLLESLLGEIALQTAQLDPDISWYSSYIFISARDSVTPYHMDREMNFLMQIRSTKTVLLWDPADDEIMTPAQKDSLLSHIGDRPHYQASFEGKAMRFELRPGLGVHHPFIAPHRVHTGPEVSITLAFTFRTRRSDTWTRAHQFNHKLRQIGLRPTIVGHHPWLDGTKSGLLQMVRRARRAVSGSRSADDADQE